ncbi:hypothetical protein EV421DRAFT_2025653 [Armillaria borealis]|uniref:Uncharacterized protein n=1 Tax=Armillaria borealis TaxID=47425 RepID=A0AA39IVC7_9AGAR|nr:hypothetical protein EV421DRAFT_2025653 [Armillaria borealis]
MPFKYPSTAIIGSNVATSGQQTTMCQIMIMYTAQVFLRNPVDEASLSSAPGTNIAYNEDGRRETSQMPIPRFLWDNQRKGGSKFARKTVRDADESQRYSGYGNKSSSIRVDGVQSRNRDPETRTSRSIVLKHTYHSCIDQNTDSSCTLKVFRDSPKKNSTYTVHSWPTKVLPDRATDTLYKGSRHWRESASLKIVHPEKQTLNTLAPEDQTPLVDHSPWINSNDNRQNEHITLHATERTRFVEFHQLEGGRDYGCVINQSWDGCQYGSALGGSLVFSLQYSINLLEETIQEATDIYGAHKGILRDRESLEIDLNRYARLELAALELREKYIQDSLNVSWTALRSLSQYLSREKYAWATARACCREVDALKSKLMLAIIKAKKGPLQRSLDDQRVANSRNEDQGTRLTIDASVV